MLTSYQQQLTIIYTLRNSRLLITSNLCCHIIAFPLSNASIVLEYALNEVYCFCAI